MRFAVAWITGAWSFVRYTREPVTTGTGDGLSQSLSKLAAVVSKASPGYSFVVVQQALKGMTLAGVLLYYSSQQSLKGPPSLYGSFSVYQLPVPMCGGEGRLQ